MLYPLKFYPIYMERIWGGTGLKQEFGKEISGEKIGESWEVSCRKEAMSRVAAGPLQGKTLEELISEYGPKLLGTQVPLDREFPLLLKILDAQDVLSVQVHPGDEYAAEHENSSGKCEVWYVLKAKPGGKIIYGLKPGVTRENFSEALRRGAVEECLNLVEVKPGEVYPVSAGIVHALGAGVMVAEFQQNSDLTYRVFDWNRFDREGKSRPLHVDQALQVINFTSVAPPEIKTNEEEERQLLTENPYFSLEMLKVSGEKQMVSPKKTFLLGMVSKGRGDLVYQGQKYRINYGDSFMIPAEIGAYSFYGEFSVLLGTAKPQIEQ